MANPPPAPWKPLLSQHISTLQTPAFTLATTTATPPYSPRLRTVIFRGFFGELPENKHNPRVYESDMLTFTTDARMAKVGELGGGAGGREVECCFWMEGLQTQWRLRGRGWVLGPEEEGGEEGEVEEVLRRYLRRADAVGEPQWTFSRELMAHFANLPLELRDPFRNPPRGTVGAGDADADAAAAPPHDNTDTNNNKNNNNSPSTSECMPQDDELGDEAARVNFRVVVVVVERAEMLDLGKSRRRVWWVGEGEGEGEGKEEEEGKGKARWRVREVWP